MNTTVVAEFDENSAWAQVRPAILFITKYLSPILLAFFMVFGVIGNATSVLIFIRRRKADRVSAQYLGVLATFDMLAILILGMPFWPFVNLETLSNGQYKMQKQMPTAGLCKFINYFWNVDGIMSGFIIIFFSTERLLVIWSPLRFGPIMQSSKPRKIALCCLFLFAVFISMGRLWWTVLKSPTAGEENAKYKCTEPDDFYDSPWITLWNFSFYMATLVPFVLVAVLNVLILIGIKKQRMTEGKSTSSSKTDRRALVNLLLISVFYILFNLPFVCMKTLFNYFQPRGFPGFSPRSVQDFLDLWLWSDTFVYYNFCINPWLYTWSLDFYRKEIKKIVCGPCLGSKSSLDDKSSRSQ